MSEPRYTLDDFNEIPGYAVGSNGKTERDSWLPLNLADLPAKPPVKPTLGRLHPDIGLVYPGMRHVFSGPPESAKTLVAYLILIQVVREGGTSILIDFEMGAYASRDRLRELGANNEDLERIMFVSPDQPATTDRVSLLIGLTPQLVCVDASAGAYDLESLDDNSRKDVGRIYRSYVLPFWQEGIATLFVDHVVKNIDNRGGFAIGSERKIGTADVHLGFDTITPISRGHKGLYKILTRKDRGGYLKRGTLAEIELVSDPDSHRITYQLRPVEEVPEGEIWMPTKVMQHISEILERAPEPISRNAAATEAGGKRDVAIKAIDHLVRLHYATETAGPRGAKLLTHTRSFTVLEWETTPPVPTYSPPVPEHVHPLVPDPVLRTGRQEQVEAPENGSPVPVQSSWIDDLEPAPREDPPADLFEQPVPATTNNDDDLPL